MIEKIEVQNLKCGGCAGTIKSKIALVDGVNSVEVDVDSSVVTVTISDSKSLDKVINRLSELGYPKAGNHNGIGQKAKSFVSCAVGKMS
jgi:copper chaperone CopZ